MIPVRQGDTITVSAGPFEDASDAVTPESGISLATADNATARLADGTTVSVTGYTMNAIVSMPGWYDFAFQAAISAQVGPLLLWISDTSVSLNVYREYIVLAPEAYDMLYGPDATGRGTVATGASETLSAAVTDRLFQGDNWTLALGGQTINGCVFSGAKSVTGTGVSDNGSEPLFRDCVLGAATLSADIRLSDCILTNTITFASTSGGSADVVTLNRLRSDGPASLDFSGVTKTTTIHCELRGAASWTLNSFCTLNFHGDGGIQTVTA